MRAGNVVCSCTPGLWFSCCLRTVNPIKFDRDLLTSFLGGEGNLGCCVLMWILEGLKVGLHVQG